jgi:4-alpha-glucanotransferase
VTSVRSELTALRRLARLYGVQTRFTDGSKCRVEARAESLVAALRGLGAPLERVADATAALGQRQAETWCWHLEPVQLAWDGALDGVELRLPADEASGKIEIEVMLENGRTKTRRIDFIKASVSSRANLTGRDYVALLLPLALPLPDGYHTLTLRAGAHELHSLVIAAPMRTYAATPDKRWGVFLPLYALHSKRSWGIGDLADLGLLVEWSAEQGADFVGTLPLLASFLDGEPFVPSPYEPVSRLFWNEIFIDIEATVTALAGSLGEDVAVPAATAKEARRLNARETVPFREVMVLKRRVLTKLTRLLVQGSAANEAAKGFRTARPALDDYAAFRAALESLGPRWREWPSPQRDGSLTDSDYDPETVDYYAFAQWQAQQQMIRLEDETRARDVRLYLDVPVGVHPDGYDAWRYQDLFVDKMSVGAPPDQLALEGQNWGFQPLNPEALRQHGYEYVRAYLSRHMEAAGLLRIDHAIGLHRLFWIPEGGSGHDGVFVRQPSEELYAILSLESHRAASVVLGENLGLVPLEVNRGMARHGIGAMYVQSFELTGKVRRPLRPPKRDSIASFGTHDLAPFAAFWTDEDLEQRRSIGVMDDAVVKRMARQRLKGKRALESQLRKRGLIGEAAWTADVYKGTTRLLAESPARWAMLSLEDTWGEARPQNIPGTNGEQHPNWVRRAHYGIEELNTIYDITDVMALMRQSRPKTSIESGQAAGRRGKEKRNGG